MKTRTAGMMATGLLVSAFLAGCSTMNERINSYDLDAGPDQMPFYLNKTDKCIESTIVVARNGDGFPVFALYGDISSEEGFNLLKKACTEKVGIKPFYYSFFDPK